MFSQRIGRPTLAVQLIGLLIGSATAKAPVESYFTEFTGNPLVDASPVDQVNFDSESCSGQVGDCGDTVDGVGCGRQSCGCGDACSCCGSPCWLPELLLGNYFCPTPRGFDRFISPITNPIFFEDPRTLTELRGIFWQHKVPLTAGGGDVNLYALQIRAAINDRLSIIATKDGYITSTNPLIGDGWADVALGLKYNLLSDPCAQQIWSAGVVYELPVGTPRTLQGNGDGEFHLFTSAGAEILRDTHWLTGLGIRQPTDDNAESQSFYWSNHFDYEFRRCWYALVEFNWYHWTGSGENTAVPGVEGLDAFNFGSVDVAGNDIVTGAFGLKYKPNRYYEFGVAWENPLTQRRDVIENRLTVDLILRY